jgi:ParB/RepB/Spo0J family partition protein
MATTKPAAKTAAAKKPATSPVKRAPRKSAAGAAAKVVAAASTGGVFGELAIELLDPGVYTNPRGAVDPKSTGFIELVESIKGLGLVQPVVVGPAQLDGKYPVLAGWQRLAAAKVAKRTSVPVHQLIDVTDAKRALEVGLAENLARTDMSPLAEARALHALIDQHGHKQTSAGALVGMSERTVRERLRLLKIHGESAVVGDAIDKGHVPMDAAVLLQKIATVSPPLATALVEAVNHEDSKGWSGSDLTRSDRVCQALRLLPETTKPLELRARGYTHGTDIGGELPLTDAQLARWGAICPEDSWDSRPPRIQFSEKELAELERAGGVLEIEGDDQYGRLSSQIFITDRTAVGELLERKLVAMEADGVKRAAIRAAWDKQNRTDAAKTGKTPEEVAAAKREREKAARTRELAHHSNVILGERGNAAAFAELALTPAGAKAVALLLLELDAGALIGAGLRYTDSEYLSEEVKKNGSVKRTYKVADARKAAAQLRTQVLAAKTAGEALAPVLRAYTLAVASDEAVVAPSNQSYWSLGHHSGDPAKIKPLFKELLEPLSAGVEAEARARADAPSTPADTPRGPAPRGRGAISGTKSKQALERIRACPGITIPELADAMGAKQNYLYRVLPELQKDGQIRKEGRGWHATASA